ncbi:MAG: PaaI family thioesterase [Pseudomonadales bacterium]|nr:PaaI family thioesterase [Pseudomonadales bacterium]
MNNTLSAHDVQQYLKEIFPQFNASILDISDKGAVVELPTDEQHLRPGGTVSGPTMMGLADAAMYVAILGKLGKVALAVTTNLNINFYRKPQAGKLRAEARVLKMGQRLAVGDVLLFCDDMEESVAHVSITYSIPPQK